MTGIAIIAHVDGWACTNEASLDADKTLHLDESGNKFSKDVLTLKLNSIFDAKGKIIVNQKIECIFKAENGAKHAFVGVVKSIGKLVTVIHELVKIDHYYTEILKKAQQWQILKT